jgi:hypothetical protein
MHSCTLDVLTQSTGQLTSKNSRRGVGLTNRVCQDADCQLARSLISWSSFFPVNFELRYTSIAWMNSKILLRWINDRRSFEISSSFVCSAWVYHVIFISITFLLEEERNPYDIIGRVPILQSRRSFRPKETKIDLDVAKENSVPAAKRNTRFKVTSPRK